MEFYIKGVENKAGYLPYFPPSVAEPPPLTAAQGLPVRAATTVLLNSAKKAGSSFSTLHCLKNL